MRLFATVIHKRARVHARDTFQNATKYFTFLSSSQNLLLSNGFIMKHRFPQSRLHPEILRDNTFILVYKNEYDLHC